MQTGASNAQLSSSVLTQDQIDTYWREGFVLARKALSNDLLDRLTKATHGLMDQAKTLTKSDRHFDLGPEHSATHPALRRISSPTELDPVFEEAIFESPVGDVVSELMGCPVKFYHAKINFKFPSTDSAIVQWHQDWTHFPHTNSNLAAISLPMTPRTVENGAIAFVPGSHKNGPLSIWKDGKYVFTCEHDVDPQVLRDATVVPCEPCDVLAHHGLTVHGSPANNTQDTCITLTIQFAAADAFAYTAPVIDSRHRNRMVRGEPARFARLEAGMIELPPDFSAGYTSLLSNQDRAKM